MELNNGTYYCKVGDMSLSPHVNDILMNRFPTILIESENKPFGSDLSKRYCPGCGVLLDKELKCSNCSKTIADLGYQLIEFHPHLKEDGSWGV
jgi:hypothetical protein